MIVACPSYPCVVVNSSRHIATQIYRFSLIALIGTGAIDGPQPQRGALSDESDGSDESDKSDESDILHKLTGSHSMSTFVRGATPPGALVHEGLSGRGPRSGPFFIAVRPMCCG